VSPLCACPEKVDSFAAQHIMFDSNPLVIVSSQVDSSLYVLLSKTLSEFVFYCPVHHVHRPIPFVIVPSQVDSSLYVLLSKALAGRPRHRDLEKAEVEVSGA